MTFKDFYKREKHVALNAQSRKFRIVKYIVLSVIAGIVYAWKGLDTVGTLFILLFIVAIVIHFLFRWKTDAWTKSWGPYKRIPLDGE